MIRTAADLFCGAGGTSTGYVRACQALGYRPDLFALNHNPTAVSTHELNHPGVRHLCEEIDRVKPQEVIPGGHLDLLCASPECTHFSLAAGGRPRNDQSRAQAWQVLRWATDLTIDNILIENVREFVNWGPLGKNGKPLKRKRGQYFQAFTNSLANAGYNLEHRILCAADYGDPTTRQRLFIMARRKKAIHWPTPSHSKGGINGLKPWRAAREIIDWDLKGESIFRRKRPLSANTMRRIAAGLRKFGGVQAEPFLVMLYGTNDARSVDRPAPTVTSGGTHIGLAEPFMVSVNHGEGCDTRRSHSLGEPFPTVDCSNGKALVQPFIVNMKGQSNAADLNAPAPTITAHAPHLYLAEPFTTMLSHKNVNPRSIDAPLQTVTTARGGEIGLVQPYIVKFYGSGTAVGLDEPLDTVTTRDRFMLVCPTTHQPIAELDILFRMLQPHELSAAQGFPTDYIFTGTREQRVKQIGNAVPVNLATALCRALLS